MKKLLLTFALLVSFTAFAHADWYKAYQFAFATVENGVYSWGDWEDSTVKINIDFDREVVTIYSDEKQTYVITDVYNDGEFYKDASGGETMKFDVIDQDNDNGEMRVRFDDDGNMQIYIDFNDCAWVYGVRKL